MADESPIARARENVVEIVSTLVTGIFLAALFTGQDWWLPFMLVGYVVIVPLTALLFGDEDDVDEWVEDADVATSTETTTDSWKSDSDRQEALETLRERYARGELTDEQFERKVERLLETETLEDVEDKSRSAPNHEITADDREPGREFS